MSERAELSRIRQRVADKWQIPVLLAAVALLVGSLLQIESPQAKIPFDTLCDRISAEIEGQMYSLAASDCRRLLKVLEDRDEPETELQAKRGRVHLLLARALAPWVERLTPDSPPNEAVAAEGAQTSGPGPGTIVNVRGQRYRVGTDGDTLEPL